MIYIYNCYQSYKKYDKQIITAIKLLSITIFPTVLMIVYYISEIFNIYIDDIEKSWILIWLYTPFAIIFSLIVVMKYYYKIKDLYILSHLFSIISIFIIPVTFIINVVIYGFPIG
jgi:hypothetical protein